MKAKYEIVLIISKWVLFGRNLYSLILLIRARDPRDV